MTGSTRIAGQNGPVAVAFWADLSCPYAYLAHHRFRRVLPEFAGRVALAHALLDPAPFAFAVAGPRQ